MREEAGSPIPTRRGMLMLAGAGFGGWGKLSAGTVDFWNRKQPSEWSSEEIQELMSQSPWAKEVRGNPGPGRHRGKTRSPKTIANYTGTVLWESAKPIRDALGSPLPDDLAGLYVLSIDGVPLAGSESTVEDEAAAPGALEKLKAVTTLRVRGKDASQPGVARQQTGNGVVYLFGFSKDALAVSRGDKEVVFETHLGELFFTARFSPKEMLYRGELAV